jgi:hypothetical protein
VSEEGVRGSGRGVNKGGRSTFVSGLVRKVELMRGYFSFFTAKGAKLKHQARKVLYPHCCSLI